MEWTLKAVLGSCAGALAYWLGGWDLGIEILLTLIFLDYLTGLASAFYNNETSSKIGFRGIVKKVSLLVLIAVAVLIERRIGQPETIHTLIAFTLSINEIVSILENLKKMGIEIPEALSKYIKLLKAKEGKDD